MSRRVTIPETVKEKLAPWYDRELLDSVRVLRGSVFGWVFGRLGQAGVTMNRTVHLTKRARDLESAAGAALLAHELFHVAQQREQGWWRYIFRYVWHWRPKHMKRGREHPMERAAYTRGDEVRRTLSDPLP
ncbi:MAG: DUF4157 domain-containing protein [Dehalococcoidia bacterium]|nr:DUF4157 domain-containing protein [Dehalococcoidia bacterium]